MSTPPLPAFGGYGIELEYMIVDRESLSVLPVSDELLRRVAGDYVAETEQGALSWSNELVLHLIELKTNGPAPALNPLPSIFKIDIQRINALLEPLGGRLMPTGMHPWMDPYLETRLWPHEYNAVYEAYNRIFDCQGHGWSNLQSVHLNLPFANEEEFARLHAAIRVLLPLLPALAASSPILEGRITGLLDTRLETYRTNARKIPSITGRVIPETVTSRADYETSILAPMYRDIGPYDPRGLLQHEWLNSRGAIARFDRSAIEIRVLDIQECPLADLAIASAVTGALKGLFAEAWVDLEAQQALGLPALEALFLATLRDAEQAVIEDRAFLQIFQFPERRCTARELWYHILETTALGAPEERKLWQAPLETILEQGPLARRILKAVGKDLRRSYLAETYRELCDCLSENRLFLGLD